MCGFAGWLASGGRRFGLDLGATARAMAAPLAHRGPDDEGLWVDEPAGLALAFRRLAVRDLSAAGHQPMRSACGRWTIVFNGEIYDTAELQADLLARGRSLRGTSDTELLLETIALHGLERTLPRLSGMFAFALWDGRERTLVLARDRVGKKPLYMARHGAGLLFGSELRALLAFPLLERHVDPAALQGLLRFGYVRGPRAILQGVERLPPGTLAVVDGPSGALRLERYWDVAEVFARGEAAPFEGDDQAAIDELEALLQDAVQRRMVADVPLGAFLSGGIDSSTVVALMQRSSPRPVRTFAIGSTDKTLDEAGFAAAVARHLGTEHRELVVGPSEALAVIPDLASRFDEPLADPSAIPTLLVAGLARRHVTVALSGDGGDELFGGYDYYRRTLRVGHWLARTPARAWAAGAALARALPEHEIARLSRFLPAALRPGGLVERLQRLAGLRHGASLEAVQQTIVATLAEPGRYLRTVGHGASPASSPLVEPLSRLRLQDFGAWLPDDILVKVDRATMAFGLEGRCPLLDHRVVELAARLPARFLERAGQSKWLLRQVLERHVPRALIDRPKRGFGLPIGDWLRGPLRPWAEELLSPARLAADEQLLAAPVRRLWDEHRARSVDRGRPLWAILIYLAWRERWLAGSGVNKEKVSSAPASPR